MPCSKKHIQAKIKSGKSVWSAVRYPNTKINAIQDEHGTKVNTLQGIVNFFFNKTRSDNNHPCKNPVNYSPCEQITKTCEKGWTFEGVTPKEVEKVAAKKLKGSSAGVCGVTPSFMKKIIQLVSEPIADLYNWIIQDKTYPEVVNTGRLLPVYKNKGERNNMHSYSLIIIISPEAKLLDEFPHDINRPTYADDLVDIVSNNSKEIITAKIVKYYSSMEAHFAKRGLMIKPEKTELFCGKGL